MKLLPKLAISAFAAACLLSGQDPNPTQRPGAGAIQPEPGIPTPIVRIKVVSRTTPAVNYLHLGGLTNIDLVGTPVLAAGLVRLTVVIRGGVSLDAAEIKDIGSTSS